MQLLDAFLKTLKVNLDLGERRSKLLQSNKIILSIFFEMFSVQVFKSFDSTSSRLQNFCKLPVISSELRTSVSNNEYGEEIP